VWTSIHLRDDIHPRFLPVTGHPLPGGETQRHDDDDADDDDDDFFSLSLPQMAEEEQLGHRMRAEGPGERYVVKGKSYPWPDVKNMTLEERRQRDAYVIWYEMEIDR
jgi:hypothetical protein